MIEQQCHLRLSCHLGDHAADQLIWLQQLSSHALLPQPIHQVVGNLHTIAQSACASEVDVVNTDCFLSPPELDDLRYRQMPADQYQWHESH